MSSTINMQSHRRRISAPHFREPIDDDDHDHDHDEQHVNMKGVSPSDFFRNNQFSGRRMSEIIDREASELITKLTKEYRLQSIWNRYILELRNFEIVIVIDDSGSMMTQVDGTERTRWDELCEIIKTILPIALLFDSNGIDIYCLNGGKYLKIKNMEDVNYIFTRTPKDFTPLVPVLKEIFQSPMASFGRDKKLLVLVATDGKPTNNDGDDVPNELEYLMRFIRNSKTTYVSFLLCTDEPEFVLYFDGWDKTMDNVDVTDDYQTELSKIRRCQENENFTFTKDDYIVKALIGAIVPRIDRLNEIKVDGISKR